MYSRGERDASATSIYTPVSSIHIIRHAAVSCWRISQYLFSYITNGAFFLAPKNPGQILAQPESEDFKGPKDFAKKILAYYMMSLKGVSKKVRSQPAGSSP